MLGAHLRVGGAGGSLQEDGPAQVLLELLRVLGVAAAVALAKTLKPT